MSDIKYELVVSRDFAAPPDVVKAAFTDAACVGAWSGPKDIRWSATPSSAVESAAHLDGEGPLVGLPLAGAPAGRLHLEFCAEPGGGTRLKIRQGLFTELGKTAARAWWNGAFSRLDRLLSRAA
jgi:hypothetical protein